MDKNEFAQKYDFTSFKEMLSVSGKTLDESGRIWYVTPLDIKYLVWTDIFPQVPQIFIVDSLKEAYKITNEFARNSSVEQDGLSSIIEDYSAKINGTDIAGLKRAYEVSRDILQELQQLNRTNSMNR